MRQQTSLTKNKELINRLKCLYKMKWAGKPNEEIGTEVLRKRMNDYCIRKRNPVSGVHRSLAPVRRGDYVLYGGGCLIQDVRMRWFCMGEGA